MKTALQPMLRSSALIAAALACGSVAAAPPNMQPGLWEITTKMEMPGMPMQMPPQTVKHCYKAEQLKDSKDALPTDKNCKLDEMKQSGNTVQWKMSCKTENGPMNGAGEITYAGQNYAGTMRMSGNMNGQKIDMKQSYSAKRLGDCK